MSEPTFRELGVSAPVVQALALRQIDAPFHIQRLVLEDALAGSDVLAKSPTGSGKTLAFAIPIVERIAADARTPAALVLVPTRELAAQVGEELDDISAACGLKVGDRLWRHPPDRPGQARLRGARARGDPGRLEDLASRKMIDLRNVSILVLDEADRMLDMGFQPQIDRIVRRLPDARQTMFFSATLDGEVGRLASAYTRQPGPP